jgi:hypothetical protein
MKVRVFRMVYRPHQGRPAQGWDVSGCIC